MSYKKNSPESIQNMFSKIASRYDLGNKVLSFNLHKRWNRKLVKELLKENSPMKVLDLCAGTGDIALEFAKNGTKHVTLLDFCQPMLDIAKNRAEKHGIHPSFSYIEGDATNLPFEENSFSLISVAYGIRNIENPLRCIQEAYRVLEPGGAFGILELTRPKNRFMGAMHSAYLSTFVPLVGSLITKEKQAYQYLNQSIKQFEADSTLDMMKNTGFKKVRAVPLNFGIANIILGHKSL